MNTEKLVDMLNELMDEVEEFNKIPSSSLGKELEKTYTQLRDMRDNIEGLEGEYNLETGEKIIELEPEPDLLQKGDFHDGLPQMCYCIHPIDETVVKVKLNVSGYFVIQNPDNKTVDELNAELGVTKAQEIAMQSGSMHGFHIPAANPARYNNEGEYVGLK